MKITLFRAWTHKAGGAILASLLMTGCTLENGAGPAVTGPSEFGLSVTLTASPDQLPRDGASQSVVTVTVRDEASRPVAGRRLIASTTLGTLSVSDVVTGSEGRATFAFTAPGPGTIGNAALVSVVPVGDDGSNAVSRLISINFTGPSNSTAPTPVFSITPTVVERNSAVRFDASATTDEGAVCLDLCTYAWDFGDGSTGTGRITSHTYASAGTFVVTLTVTDRAGSSASLGTALTVKDVPAPTVKLTVAPNPPIAGQAATFTATVSVAPGHGIKTFAWTFGDGTSQTTTSPTVTKVYDMSGLYVVTVTATDDLGQTGADALAITIGSGVTATFTSSPAAPAVGGTVSFNGSASTTAGGATIVTWAWDFGDGTSTSETSPATSHAYTLAGTYKVRLTVTDSLGRTGTASADVVVK